MYLKVQEDKEMLEHREAVLKKSHLYGMDKSLNREHFAGVLQACI